MPGYIHHIEWGVADLEKISRRLVGCFGFSKFAKRTTTTTRAAATPTSESMPWTEQVAVRSGKTVFLLTQYHDDKIDCKDGKI